MPLLQGLVLLTFMHASSSLCDLKNPENLLRTQQDGATKLRSMPTQSRQVSEASVVTRRHPCVTTCYVAWKQATGMHIHLLAHSLRRLKVCMHVKNLKPISKGPNHQAFRTCQDRAGNHFGYLRGPGLQAGLRQCSEAKREMIKVGQCVSRTSAVWSFSVVHRSTSSKIERLQVKLSWTDSKYNLHLHQ